MPVDLERKLIDPEDQELQTMFWQLQGNILKGHGRDHTVHIFVRFAEDVDLVRKRLGALAQRLVTSAAKQHRETTQFKKYKIPGALFGNLLLTAQGYRALGFSDDQIVGGFPEAEGDFGIQASFRAGMRASREELNDPPLEQWEKPYAEERIDAMLLLADDDEKFLQRAARDLMHELEGLASIVTVETGRALRNQQKEGIEHFGYVDGRSQPIYFRTDLKDEGDTTKWDPAEPLKRVLVSDVLAGKEDAFGSYFVFRKLEQDVRRFKIREHELADELGLDDEARELAGALAVGRFEDGTPVTLSQTDGFIPEKENNFTYADDSNAQKCPFHAHIRKTNPRGDLVRKFGGSEEDLERKRRITRRGITYGERNMPPNALQGLEDLPTGGVGLLFMCFQSSIANQFAFMQRAWANDENFLNQGTGLDPIIGEGAQGANASAQQWPVEWGGAATKPFSFAGFVHMKGGEFFFAPSMAFFDNLASQESSDSA
jgi:Dyp-type peroxidase family